MGCAVRPLDEELSFRAAAVALKRKRDPYGRKLRRMVLAREQQTGKMIAVRLAVGPERTALRITMGALYRAFPELQPAETDKLASIVAPLVQNLDDRMRAVVRKVLEDDIAPRIQYIEQLQKLTETYLHGLDELRPRLEGLPPPVQPGVYAIQGVGEFVKIGRAQNIAQRVKEIQTGHPVTLRLLAVLSPNPNDEFSFHDRFSTARVQGEWFIFTPALRLLIMAARASYTEQAPTV